MNEELIRQCARASTSPSGAIAAIRLYHARHVAPLVELLKRCRDREHNPFEPDNQTALYRDICTALSAFDTGTPRPGPDVTRLGQENAELRALVKQLTAQAKADGERIGRLEGNVAPLVEAVKCTAAPDEASMTGWSDEYIRGWAYAAARIARETLAPFQQENPDAAD